jgi:hypothetical protein
VYSPVPLLMHCGSTDFSRNYARPNRRPHLYSPLSGLSSWMRGYLRDAMPQKPPAVPRTEKIGFHRAI